MVLDDLHAFTWLCTLVAMAQIHIVRSLDAAWTEMIRILFQPFQWRKWLGLGFCAFLADLIGGCSASTSTTEPERLAPFWKDPWMLTAVIIIGIIALVITLLFTWLSCRGKFMFLDGVVHNRGAIVHSWREYRKEAWSLFLFYLTFSAFVLFVFIVFACAAWLVRDRVVYDVRQPMHLLGSIGFAAFAIMLGIAAGIITCTTKDFIVPAMYLRRSRYLPEARKLLSLASCYPVEFISYLLLRMAVSALLLVLIFVGLCLTCCMAALPYISSVVFLPLLVWVRLFPIYFLAEFGGEWNMLVTRDTLVVPSALVPPPLPPMG